MLIIRAPAEFEPINGLRCAEPLLSERESAARARSVYTHHEPKFGAAPRFRENPRHHLFAQRPIFKIAKGGALAIVPKPIRDATFFYYFDHKPLKI